MDSDSFPSSWLQLSPLLPRPVDGQGVDHSPRAAPERRRGRHFPRRGAACHRPRSIPATARLGCRPPHSRYRPGLSRAFEARRGRRPPCAERRTLTRRRLRRFPKYLLDILSNASEECPPLPQHLAGSREDAKAGLQADIPVTAARGGTEARATLRWRQMGDGWVESTASGREFRPLLDGSTRRANLIRAPTSMRSSRVGRQVGASRRDQTRGVWGEGGMGAEFRLKVAISRHLRLRQMRCRSSCSRARRSSVKINGRSPIAGELRYLLECQIAEEVTCIVYQGTDTLARP
jgi:hypothetical protein